MHRYGLLGKNISYSFSRQYFSKKFSREGINAIYENYDLQEVNEVQEVLASNAELKGLNVTIPYKQEIIPFLHAVDPVATEIGAVNTIKIEDDGRLTGYNTDHFGFSRAIQPHLKKYHQKALILGTGGASKAVDYALHTLGIQTSRVSRNSSPNNFSYDQLSSEVLQEFLVIVNATPLGTFPKTEEYPPLPVGLLTPRHLVFDLVYNPSETKLMALAREQGATVLNGQKMLEFQAEMAWEIWNKI